MNNQLTYFEYYTGTFKTSTKIIINQNENIGVKITYTTNFTDEIDSFGNKKANKIENKTNLTEEQIKKLYNFITDNIYLKV